MTTQFIRREADVFPAAARVRAHQQIQRVEVVLSSGERAELSSLAVALIEALRQGLAGSKVAHLELDEETVTPERAAHLLGATRPTIYTWQDRGRLGRLDVGAKRMVPLADIEQLRNSSVRSAMLKAVEDFSPDEPEIDLTPADIAAARELFG